jgi:hypothetical protein
VRERLAIRFAAQSFPKFVPSNLCGLCILGCDRTTYLRKFFTYQVNREGFAWFVNWGSCAFAAAAAWLAGFGLAAQSFIPPLSYRVYTSNIVSCFL